MAWTCPEELRWLHFSPSGLLVATTGQVETSADYLQYLRLWDAISGRELASREYTDVLHSVTFVSERELIIVGEQGAALWDTESDVVKEVGNRYEGAGVGLPGGRAVFRGNGEVTIVDLRSRKVRQRLRVPLGTSVYGDEMQAGGRFLAACCRGQDEYGYQQIQVALWDIELGKRLRTYDIEGGKVRWDDWPKVVLALHPEDPRIAVATTEVRSFGPDYEDELEGFKPYKSKIVHDLRYSADGRVLLVLGEGQVVRLDALTGKVLSKFKIPSSLAWDKGEIDPAGEKVVVMSGQQVEVLDLLD